MYYLTEQERIELVEICDRVERAGQNLKRIADEGLAAVEKWKREMQRLGVANTDSIVG